MQNVMDTQAPPSPLLLEGDIAWGSLPLRESKGGGNTHPGMLCVSAQSLDYFPAGRLHHFSGI